MTVVDDRAFFCIRHLDRLFESARTFQVEDVRRARQHNLLLLTIEQVEKSQLVRVGMRLHLTNFRHDNFFFVPRDAVGFEFVLLAVFVRGHIETRIKNLVNFETSER